MRVSTAGIRVWWQAACLTMLAAGLAGCSAPQDAQSRDVATVWVNGVILTLDETLGEVEAVAMQDGRILAAGSRDLVTKAAGEGAILRDLQGAVLAPGFIDTHGHFALTAQAAGMANLQPPPAGPIRTIPELQHALEQWSSAHPDAPWITGWGYDDSLLAEGRHPTRDDLDAVSPDKPVLLLHTSAHFAACNSVCLEIIGVGADTPDPPGGVIRRSADGRTPDGVLEETAMYPIFQALPAPVKSQRIAGILAVQQVYASRGITTVQEGAAQAQTIQDLKEAAESGGLYLDVVAYQHFQDGAVIDESFAVSRNYENHFRTGGIKLVLDGSPQGRTAWLTKPYVRPPAGQTADYAGYGIYSDNGAGALMESALLRGAQVIAHANGDRAIDQYLDRMIPLIEANPGADLRPVVIHAQTVRPDQLEKMAEAGIIPSFFAAHPFFWGDWHRDAVLGPERAAFISPLAAAKALDIPYTIHNDPPVVPPDVMRLIWVAVSRETRSGAVLGPDQRAAPLDALRAVTIHAARQYFEEADKGSITPGKRADLVVLSANPLTVDAGAIRDIRILETLKDGITIYTAAPNEQN